MSALAEAGFTAVINNRPDTEIGPDHHSDVMRQAAEAAGLKYVVNPLTMDSMTPDRQALQRETLDTCEDKVLAYCRSGTRSTICWALSVAPDMDTNDIVEAAANGGYDLNGLAPTLRAIAERD